MVHFLLLVCTVQRKPIELWNVEQPEDNRGKNIKSKKQSKQGGNGNTEKTYYIHKYSKGIPLAEAVIVRSYYATSLATKWRHLNSEDSLISNI